MALILHSRWNKQPTYDAPIDWANSLTRGLIGAFTPYSKSTFSFNAKKKDGIGAYGAFSVRLSVELSNRLVNAGTYFALLNYTGVTLGQYNYILGAGQTTTEWTDNDQVLISTTGTTTQESCVIRKNSSSLPASGRTVKTSGIYATAITFPSGSANGAVFENGAYQVAATYTGAAKPFATGKKREIYSEIAYMFAAWDRELSNAEIKAISFDPWQLFIKQKTVAVPTYYPILSNLQATRGNTSASLRTNITY